MSVSRKKELKKSVSLKHKRDLWVDRASSPSTPKSDVEGKPVSVISGSSSGASNGQSELSSTSSSENGQVSARARKTPSRSPSKRLSNVTKHLSLKLSLTKSPSDTNGETDSSEANTPVKSEQKHKVQFEVFIKQVTDLPNELNGHTVCLSWQRGSKETSGTTKHVLVTSNTAAWEEKIIFTSSFIRQEGGFPSKSLDFKLKDDRVKAAVGKCSIDLSQHLSDDGSVVFSEDFYKGKFKLKYRIKANLILVGNQQLNGTTEYVSESDSATKHVKITLPHEETEHSSFSDLSLESDESPAKKPSGKTTVSSTGNSTSSSSQVKEERVSMFNDLKRQLNEKDILIQQYELNAKTYEQELDSQQERIIELQNTNKSLKKKLEDAKKHVADIPSEKDSTNSELNKTNSQLEQKNEELKEELENLKYKLRQTTKEMEMYKNKAENLNREITSLKKEYEEKLENGEQLTDKDWLKSSVQRVLNGKFSSPMISTPSNLPGNSTNSSRRHSFTISTPNSARNSEPQSPSSPVSDKSSAMDALALELAVCKRTARLVYHGPHDMDVPPIPPNNGKQQVFRLPRATLEIFDMLSTEEIFTKNPRNIMTVLGAIQGVTTEIEPITKLEVASYWLSTACYLHHCISNYKGTNPIRQYIIEVDKVILHVYSTVVRLFCAETCPFVLDIFCSDQESDSFNKARLDPSKKRSHSPLLYSPTYSNCLPFSSPTTATPTAPMEFMDLDGFLKFMGQALMTFQKFTFPVKMIKLLFRSVLSEIGRTLFNELISRDDICTAETGISIKLAISRLQGWNSQKSVKPFVGNASKKLERLSQFATVLTIDKTILVNEPSMLATVCPLLNMHQVQRIVTIFKPDKILADKITQSVINKLEKLVLSETKGNDKKNFSDTVILLEDLGIPTDLSFLHFPISVIASPK